MQQKHSKIKPDSGKEKFKLKKEKTIEQKRKIQNIKMFFLRPEVALFIPIIILCIYTQSQKPNFLTWRYFSSILMASSYIGTATIGIAIITLVGETDLSVGLSGTLAGVIAGYAVQNFGAGVFGYVLVGLVFGVCVGLLNGYLITHFKLPAWIVTMAVMYICDGFSNFITNGVPISLKSLGVSDFFSARPLGLNWIFIIFVMLLVLTDILIRCTKLGYQITAVGGNAKAALMAGIDVNKIKIIAFVLCSVFSVIGGLFDGFNNGTVKAGIGSGRNFRAVTACAIGGMIAGEGTILGTAIGVLLFHVLWYALRILEVDTNQQLVFIGVALIASVLLSSIRKKIEEKNLATMSE